MTKLTEEQVKQVVEIIQSTPAPLVPKTVREYIGARYVPVFANPLEWSDTREYEPLTIVTYQGNSYTSMQYVPTGIEITNTSFWALTGNYNAQMTSIQQQVNKNVQEIGDLQDAVDMLPSQIDLTIPRNSSMVAMMPKIRHELRGGALWQGGAAFKVGDQEYYVVVERVSDQSSTIRVYNSGNVNTVSIEVDNVLHGASACFVEGKFYVSQGNGNRVQVYNVNPSSISFDSTIEFPNLQTTWGFTYDGEFYYVASQSMLYKFSPTALDNPVATFTISDLNTSSSIQGLVNDAARNRIGLVFSYPEHIMFIDKALKGELNILAFETNYGCILFKEIEWATIIDDDIYVGVNSGYNQGVLDTAPQTVLKSNLLHNFGWEKQVNTTASNAQFIVNLDYQGGEEIPEFGKTGMTVKYTQDVNAINLGLDTLLQVNVLSDNPGMLTLTGGTATIMPNGHTLGGIYTYAGRIAVYDTTSTFWNDATWLAEAGIRAHFGTLFVTIPAATEEPTKKYISADWSIIRASQTLLTNSQLSACGTLPV